MANNEDLDLDYFSEQKPEIVVNYDLPFKKKCNLFSINKIE